MCAVVVHLYLCCTFFFFFVLCLCVSVGRLCICVAFAEFFFSLLSCCACSRNCCSYYICVACVLDLFSFARSVLNLHDGILSIIASFFIMFFFIIDFSFIKKDISYSRSIPFHSASTVRDCKPSTFYLSAAYTASRLSLGASWTTPARILFIVYL